MRFLRPLAQSIGANGRRLDSFVLETDLYIEPTQKQVEQSTSDYVPFLDFNNRLLDELTSIINTSPTCRGIIMQKVNMSQGKGFSVSEGKQNALLTILKKLRKSLGMTDARIEELNDCIIKVNPEGETLGDLTNKAYFDFWAYGNAFIEVIKTTIQGECRVAQRHIPMEWCRPKKAVNRVVEFIGISSRLGKPTRYTRTQSQICHFTQILNALKATRQRSSGQSFTSKTMRPVSFIGVCPTTWQAF